MTSSAIADELSNFLDEDQLKVIHQKILLLKDNENTLGSQDLGILLYEVLKQKEQLSNKDFKNGNIQSAQRFAEAFKRVDIAIRMGFYIEATSIAECLISNRLKRLLTKHYNLDLERTNFSELIDTFKKYQNSKTTHQFYAFTPTDMTTIFGCNIDKWRRSRNTIIHQFMDEGRNHKSMEDYLKFAHRISVEGEQLMRYILRWTQAQSRIIQSIEKDYGIEFKSLPHKLKYEISQCIKPLLGKKQLNNSIIGQIEKILQKTPSSKC